LSDQTSSLQKTLKKEAALFVAMLFVGLVLLPMLVWFVGKAVFGAYGGHGFADFFGTLSGRFRSGDLGAWFLALSPWLALQIIRLAVAGWRLAGKL
jgi:hypothetical protein